MSYQERVEKVKCAIERGDDLNSFADKSLQDCFDHCLIDDQLDYVRVLADFLGDRLLIDKSIVQQQCLCEMFICVRYLVLKKNLRIKKLRKWRYLENWDEFEEREERFNKIYKEWLEQDRIYKQKSVFT